ncbi:MAG: hypothetical protein AB2604_10755 [Candidatus Thiodiazotropha taylori]
MIRLILSIIILLVSFPVNAGDKDHFYSISLSYVYSDLGKPEGILDGDADTAAHLDDRSTSANEFDETSTDRYGIAVTKGAFLTETSHWLASKGIDVFGEMGLFIHPGYFVEADGRYNDSHLELNMDTFGGLAMVGLRYKNFNLKGGLHISYTEAEVSYWRVDPNEPTGLYESQKQVDDWSTGYVIGISYNFLKDMFLAYRHSNGIGSVNWVGLSSAHELLLQLRFR